MSTVILADIDGKHVPLSDCDWVLFGSSGRPYGVTVGWAAPDEEPEWKIHSPRKRDRERAQRRGDHIELMTHERYSREIYPRMLTRRERSARQHELPRGAS